MGHLQVAGRFTRAAKARSGYEDPMTRGKDQRHMETEEEVSDQHKHVYGGTRKGEIHKPTVEDNTET